MTTTERWAAAAGRRLLAALAMALGLAWAHPAPCRAADAGSPNLAGAWQLNPELTERLMQKQSGGTAGEGGGKESGHGKHQGGMDAFGGGPQGEGGMGVPRPAGAPHEPDHHELGITFALRDRFTIAQEGNQIVLSDGQGGAVTVRTDGRRVHAASMPGGPAEVRASWERDGTLKLEVRPDRGPKRTESYVVSNDRKHLYVTITALRVSGETVQLIRAFDQTPSAEPKAEGAPAAAPPPGA